MKTNLPRKNKSSKQGFSLIEIAIVIVVIGLLIGGLSIGTGLLRSSQLQTFIKDLQSYEEAIFIFKEKYGYYPGDMPTASNFWDVSAATSGNYNGNGDSDIGDATGASPDSTEGAVMWLHMTKSNILKENYTGLDTGTSGSGTTGTSYPQIEFDGRVYGDADSTGNHLVFEEGDSGGDFLLPKDAHFIDVKQDDEDPDTGEIRAQSVSGNCISSGEYDFSQSDEECSLHYYFDLY